MPVTTSFNIELEQAAYLQEQVAIGRYAGSSEVIREALRMHELEARKQAWILKHLDDSLASDLAPETHEELLALGKAELRR